MALTENLVTLKVEHYRGQFPSDWLYITTAHSTVGVSTAVLEEQGAAQLHIMSPCCRASVVARGKHSSTAAFYSKDWTCTACDHNYGDEPWRITVARNLEQYYEALDSEECGTDPWPSTTWSVTDTGVLESLLETRMNVLDATMARLDLIALLEEIFNWTHQEYGRNPRGVLMAAAGEFGGRDLWTPVA